MAELDKLVIEISADDARFVQSLTTLKNGLADFGKQGSASADEVAKALRAVEKAALSTNDAVRKQELVDAYIKLNTELQRAKKEFRDLTKIVPEVANEQERAANSGKKLSKNIADVDESSRRARIAVYGLNQVVRDLPFGFIAISNNIPVFIDQFQELIKTNKSTRAAFKEFAAGLLGAGGVSVAISAVISLITASVQKYGSLSGAITALTSDLGPLIERLNEANKSYEKFLKESLSLPDVRTAAGVASDSDIARLDNLIRGLRDENKTNQEKEQILKRISSQYGDIFQGYDLQKSNLKSVIDVLEAYKSTIRNAEAEKGFATQLDDTNKKLAEQKVALNAVNLKLDAAKKNQAAVSKQYFDAAAKAEKGGVNPFANQYTQATFELTKLREEQKRIETQIRGLIISTYEYGKSVDDTANSSISSTAKVAELAAATLKKTETTRASAQNKEVKDNLAILQAKLAQEKSYLTTLNSLNKDFEDQQIKIATLERDIKAAQLTKQITDRQQLSEALKAIELDLQNEITRIVGEGVTRRVEYWKADGEAGRKAAEETRKAFEAIPKAVPDSTKIISPQQIQAFLKQVDASRQTFVENENARLQALTDQALLFANAIGNFTGDFVQGLMNGESAIDGLVDGMKKLAKEIAIAAAKAIALELVYQALNIASGGTAGTAAKKGVGIIEALRKTGRVSAPNINPTMGMMVGPGGVAIQGNVTLVQRGQDLVGVLARSNARINRVG
jgi:hypothetical protein